MGGSRRSILSLALAGWLFVHKYALRVILHYRRRINWIKFTDFCESMHCNATKAKCGGAYIKWICNQSGRTSTDLWNWFHGIKTIQLLLGTPKRNYEYSTIDDLVTWWVQVKWSALRIWQQEKTWLINCFIVLQLHFGVKILINFEGFAK